MRSQINLRVSDAHRAYLEARNPGNLSAGFRLTVDRLDALQADGRKRAARILDGSDIGLICDALNGILTTDTTLWLTSPLLAMTLEDSAPALAAKWQVDPAALVGKVRSLDPAALAGLLDAVERFWNRVEAGEQCDPAEALR